MRAPVFFLPPRRFGLLFQAGMVLLLITTSLWGLIKASAAEVGPTFLLYLLPAFLAVVLAPLTAYRLYSLYVASYAVERDGLHLRWGLRSEVVPMDQVLWVSPAASLNAPLPRLWFGWPGSWLGVRRLADGTPVEYLAARAGGLIVVATPDIWYVISPASVEGFLETYRRLTELGSLSPLAARSTYPTFLASRLWADLPARILILAGLALNLILLVWVSFLVPGLTQVSLHPPLTDQSRDYVPAVQLLLLPVLSGIFFVADVVTGLFFYRRTVDRPNAWHSEQSLSYLLWAGGAFTPAVFLGAVYFILNAG